MAFLPSLGAEERVVPDLSSLGLRLATVRLQSAGLELGSASARVQLLSPNRASSAKRARGSRSAT